MTFTKFVEIGRVAQVNYGEQEGNLAVIVDIVNENRALVDGPKIARQVIPIKRLRLTKFKVPVSRGARTGVVRKIIQKEGFEKTWAASSIAKSIANRTRRANLNDFERFKAMVLRKRLSKLQNVRPAAAKKAPASTDKKVQDKKSTKK